jgi:hypothetical protein
MASDINRPDTVSARTVPAARGLAPNRQLALWLASLGSSLCADQVFFLALTWAAIQVGSPAQVGLVVAAVSVPRLALLLLGGTLADRLSPRLLAVVSDIGRALAVAVAVVVVVSIPLQIWQLVLIAVLVGALDGFFMPAIGALPALIAPTTMMARVGSLRAVVQRVALLLAGPLSGGVIAWAGTAAGLLAAVALFLLSVGFLLLLVVGERTTAARRALPDPPTRPTSDPAPRRPASLRSDLVGGLAVVRRHPVLPSLLLLVAALNLAFAGPVTAGLPLLARESGWGASGAGALLGAFGLGAAVTGIGMVAVRVVPRAGLVLLVGLATMGGAIAAFALASDLVSALLDAVVLGLGSGVVSSIVYGLLFTGTPAAALGRVMALVSLTLEGTFPVSNYVTGVLTQAQGAALPFLLGGALLVAAAAVATAVPAIRTVRLGAPAAPAAPTRPVEPAVEPVVALASAHAGAAD